MHANAVVLRRQLLLGLYRRLRLEHLQDRLIALAVKNLGFAHQAVRVLQQKQPVLADCASLRILLTCLVDVFEL